MFGERYDEILSHTNPEIPLLLSLITPDTGPESGGTYAHITGSGFYGPDSGAGTRVVFETSPGSYTDASDVAVESDTSIYCTTPPGVGIAGVLVIASDGDNDFVQFTYTVVPAQFTKYGGILAKLLPPGSLWHMEAGSELQRTLVAMGDEFQRIEDRAAELIEESDPRTATETLADWERVLSLPDDVVTAIPATTAGRRVAITQKYVARGGANEEFYGTICAACGYPLGSGLLDPPVITSVVASSHFGSGSGPGTYTYRVTALTAAGESLPSAVGSVVTAGTGEKFTITWEAVPHATGYKVYGNYADSELLLDQGIVGADTLSFSDLNMVPPAGAMPTVNTATYDPIKRYAGNGLLRVDDRVGDRVYGAAYAYAIMITLDTPTAGALTQTQFEAAIRARTHSHITVVFTYL